MASTNIQTFPGKVGVSNTNPVHTLDIGSNVYIDDTGANKLTVTGNIHASGITIDGDITVIDTQNLAVKDPVILLASESTGTSDTGIIMKRADGDSNVAVFYDEGVGLKICHTMSGADDTQLVADTSNALNTSIYGAVTIENTTSQALSVGGGAQIDGDFQVGEVANLFVDVSTSNVGIGTAVPAYELDVVGNVHADYLIGDGSAISAIQSSNVSDFASNVTRITNLESGDMTIDGEKTFSSNLEVGTANLFVDTTTSNVGIGTTTPGYDLDVNGDINFTGTFYQGGSPFVSSLWTAGSDSLYYRSNVEVGTANLFVDTTMGNVGVGTTNPGFSLDVHGTANVGALTTTSVSGSGSGLTALNADNISSGTLTRPVNTSTVTIDDYLIHDGDADTKIGFPATDTFTVTTANSERMRVDSSGNVGIGVATPSYKLAIQDGNNDGADVTLTRLYSQANASGVSSTGLRLEKGVGYGGVVKGYISQGVGSGLSLHTLSGGGTELQVMTLRNNGNVGIGTDNPGQKLDVRSGNIRLHEGNSYGVDRYIYTKWEDTLNDHSIGMEFDYYAGTGGTGTTHSRLNFVSNATLNEEINGSGKQTMMSVLSNGNVGIGVANPSYNLHVDGITRLNAYSGSSSGTFSGSGTFYLPPNLDAGGYDGSPRIAWELHLVYGFTGTNRGVFYISGSQDTSSSVVSVSEPGCIAIRPGGYVTAYSTCYLSPDREVQASGYYAIIRLGQAGTGFNIPKLSNITANRFHFMYQSVGCFANVGASTSHGQGFFTYPSASRRPKYIRVTCNTGSVQGNWMLKKITI